MSLGFDTGRFIPAPFRLAQHPPEDLPTARPVAGGIEYVVHRLKAASETGFTVEHTADLAGEWTPAVNGVDEVTIVIEPLNETHDRIVVTIPTTGDRIFVRLKL